MLDEMQSSSKTPFIPRSYGTTFFKSSKTDDFLGTKAENSHWFFIAIILKCNFSVRLPWKPFWLKIIKLY